MSNSSPGHLTVEAFTRQSKLFELLDAAGRQRLMAIAVAQAVPTGEVVVREGDPGDSFYVITKGVVAVNVDDFGTSKEMARLGPGNFFGEIAVVTAQPRSATVTAVGPVELLRFDKQAISEVLKDYPKVREVLAKMGLRRSEDTLEKMAGLMDEPTPDPDAGSST